jgi:hypothetical protein
MLQGRPFCRSIRASSKVLATSSKGPEAGSAGGFGLLLRRWGMPFFSSRCEGELGCAGSHLFRSSRPTIRLNSTVGELLGLLGRIQEADVRLS